jgi:hypothetical protein
VAGNREVGLAQRRAGDGQGVDRVINGAVAWLTGAVLAGRRNGGTPTTGTPSP